LEDECAGLSRRGARNALNTQVHGDGQQTRLDQGLDGMTAFHSAFSRFVL
jgi:hypothetical protein